MVLGDYRGERYFSQELFEVREFKDRFLERPSSEAIDIIMPILNTNLFFRRNLLSIYRELPVSRLLIGDGGSTDDSLEILSDFPRVHILNHSGLNTLGASLAALMREVQTASFGYLHSDVFLPSNFADGLAGRNLRSTWLETSRNLIVIHEESSTANHDAPRSYSGAQFGDSEMLKEITADFSDDFLYRNEDIVIGELVKAHGGKFHKTDSIRHLHQAISKNSSNEPQITVNIQRRADPDYEIRTQTMQYRGIIKYLDPTHVSPKSYLVSDVNLSLQILCDLDAFDWSEVRSWILSTNEGWLNLITPPKRRSKTKIGRIYQKVKGRLLRL